MANKEKFTRDQIIAAMWNTGAIVMDMAKQLNTSTKVIYEYLQRYPDLDHEKRLVEAATLDLAQSGLLRALKNREPWAIKFYLHTKGKHLGYTMKLQIEPQHPNAPQAELPGEVDYKNLPTETLLTLIEHTIEDEEKENKKAG